MEKALAERTLHSHKLILKYPDCVPVIIKKAKETDPDIDKSKYLVPRNLPSSEFINIIRKRIKIDSKQAIFIFINNTLIPMHASIQEIYSNYKSEDSILYIKYTLENTFG